MTKLTINGKDYTSNASGLDVFDILTAENSQKTITRSISADITLKGEAYDLIRESFFTSCQGFLTELKASIYLDLCSGVTFDGKITAEGLTLNAKKKTAKIVIKGSSIEQSAYVKLGQDYFWENGFTEFNELPVIYFTKQNYNTGLFVVLRSILSGSLLPLIVLSKVLAGTILVLCKAYDAINVFKKVDCPSFDQVDFIDRGLEYFDNAITGNGKWAPGVIIREAVDFQCQVAGIKFVSSLINNPSSSRYNLTIWSLEGSKHGDKNTPLTSRNDIFAYNAPLMTTFGLLDSIKEMFYADYKIIGDTLFFEPIDFFDDFRKVELKHQKCTDIEFKYNADTTYAYGEFFYTPDAYDMEGPRMFNKYYSEKLDFNNPPIEAQKGRLTVEIPYSPTRFMRDQESAVQDSNFDFDLQIDLFKEGKSLKILTLVDNQGVKREGDMVITADSTQGYKLFVLEDFFNRDDAKVIRRPYKTITTPFGKFDFYEYNYPLYLNEESRGSLSEDFLYRYNPRISNTNMGIEDQVVLNCNCDAINEIINNPYSIYLPTEYGKACPKTAIIKVDYKRGVSEIVLSDFHIICN